MIAAAEIVVRQRLDHIAILNVVAVAACGDAVEFLLEEPKFGDLVPHHLQLSVGDVVSVGARAFRMGIQREKLSDGLDREAEVARMMKQRRSRSRLS